MERSSTITRARSFRTALLTAALVLSTTGCAQVMAYRQPPPLDRDFLQPGVERPTVAGVLGKPVATEQNDRGGERLTESYAYTDGGKANTWLGKTGRILVYTAGDVFTAFLTQAIWIPAELLMDGTDYVATVDYERRLADGRWVARRIVESGKDDGEQSFARGELPAVSVAADGAEEAEVPLLDLE